MSTNYVIWFENLRMTLWKASAEKMLLSSEMISQLSEKGVRVPQATATTADAYRAFLFNGLSERISAALSALDVDDVVELARVGKEIRQWILDTPFPSSWIMKLPKRGKMVADAGEAKSLWPCALLLLPKTCRTLRFQVSKKHINNGLKRREDAMKHVFASLYNDRHFLSRTQRLCPRHRGAVCGVQHGSL